MCLSGSCGFGIQLTQIISPSMNLVLFSVLASFRLLSWLVEHTLRKTNRCVETMTKMDKKMKDVTRNEI
jgi:hypothetical protein